MEYPHSPGFMQHLLSGERSHIFPQNFHAKLITGTIPCVGRSCRYSESKQLLQAEITPTKLKVEYS